MKIVNTDGENLHIFWTTRGILIKVSGKMSQKAGFYPLPKRSMNDALYLMKPY